MNREQRRGLEKRIRKRGSSAQDAKAYVEIINNADAIRSGGTGQNTPPNSFQEGDKVHINLEAVKNRTNYERMSKPYKDFVESSEGVVYTAHVEGKNMISLVECPRWLFWSGDLEKAEQES